MSPFCLLLPFLLALSPPETEASVVLNEVAYSGGGDVCDGSDWVELANYGTDVVSLDGYILHDDKGPEDTKAVTFKGTTLDSGEYLILCKGGGFTFGIGGDDSITLLDARGRTISTTGTMPATGDDGSTFAIFDGMFSYTSTPTPGAANILSVPQPLGDVLEEQNKMGLDFFRLNDDGSIRPSITFGEVVDLFIDLSDADLAYMTENPSYEQYVPFQSIKVKSGGVDVAAPNLPGRIRTKGQSTLIMPVCMGAGNPPFNIKFGGGSATETFFGMRNAYLRNHYQDNSYIREYTIHRLNARFGLPFLRTRHVRFHLNGKYVGFYTMMEAPDQDYVMWRSLGPFDPATTGLFKFKLNAARCWYGIKEKTIVDKESEDEPDPYYFNRGEHRDKIPIIGKDEQSCNDFYKNQGQKEIQDIAAALAKHGRDCAKASVEVGMVDLDFGPKSLKDPMETFLRENIFAKDISSLPHVVNTNQWLRNFASYAVTIGLDSPFNLNNWYLATSNGGRSDWKIVQYDHNQAMSHYAADFFCSPSCSMRMIYWPVLRPSCGALENNPILGPFFAVQENVDRYVGYVEEFVNLLDDNFFAELRNHSTAIKAYVLEDPLSRYTAEEFDKHELSAGYDDYNTVWKPLVKTLQARKEQVVNQLAAIQAGTLPRNGKYEKEELCPDWRDSEGMDYIRDGAFVPGEKCPAVCKNNAYCFSTRTGKGGCNSSGEMTSTNCKNVQLRCRSCFPYSPCGSLEDESARFGKVMCNQQNGMASCSKLSHCFSHRTGQCAFDGEIIGERVCKLADVCKVCYPRSRCGTIFSLEDDSSRPSPVPSPQPTTEKCVDKTGSFTVSTPTPLQTTCQQIHFLRNKPKRISLCKSVVKRTKELMTNRCPIACARRDCYAFHNSCKDSKERFMSQGVSRTCATVQKSDTTLPNVCGSLTIPGSGLVQEKCPVTCSNIECTCADKEISFVTAASTNSDTGKQIEPERERNCSQLYGIDSMEYRNVVCLLDIYAVTPYFQTTLKVYYMCPKACGFRKECFCRDTKKAITTPNSRNVSYCKDVKSYNGNWCDETKEPVFARSCPVICGNPYCNMMNRSDSRDTLSFSVKNEQISTTCWLIWKAKDSNEGRDEYACDAYETDLNLKGSVLCPNACAGNIPFK